MPANCIWYSKKCSEQLSVTMPLAERTRRSGLPETNVWKVQLETVNVTIVLLQVAQTADTQKDPASRTKQQRT
jgi:hypothetical protein